MKQTKIPHRAMKMEIGVTAYDVSSDCSSIKSFGLEQQIEAEQQDFDESLYFRVHNERSKDARQVYRDSVKAKNKKTLDKSSSSQMKRPKREEFGEKLDKIYGPEEDKIKKILTKKILERLQKQKQKQILHEKAKQNFNMITKKLTGGLFQKNQTPETAQVDFINDYLSSDYDCISEDEKQYMKKYQQENQRQFEIMKKGKTTKGGGDTPSPYRKRGTSSKQQRSSGGTGGPTW